MRRYADNGLPRPCGSCWDRLVLAARTSRLCRLRIDHQFSGMPLLATISRTGRFSSEMRPRKARRLREQRE